MAGLATDGPTDGNPPFDDGLDHVVGGVDTIGGHEGGMFDPVDTGGYRIGDGLGRMGVGGDWQVPPVGLLDHSGKEFHFELGLVRSTILRSGSPHWPSP